MADLYTRFVSGLVFPLHETLKGHATVSLRREMESTQWWTPERLADLQAERLGRLIRHAAVKVPYYRDLFRAHGIDPAGINGMADLQRIPFLTKEIIRNQGEAMKSDHAGALLRMNTGGSTGEPLIFWLGKQRISHDVAAKWRATRWWGVDIGDREIVLWGSPIEVGNQDRIRSLRDRVLRSRLLSAFEMSEENVKGFLETIRSFRPKMLFGYPSALAYLARQARRSGLRVDNLGIEVVFVTSEQLYDDQRTMIETTFGCPVANGYGGRDAGFIAHQCPDLGMHITAEDIVVEIVDEQGRVQPPGTAGEVVITHLATADFPFIRYRTGDVAVVDRGRCPCGRGLPLLQAVHGRTTDFIVAGDGKVMHGLALIYVIRDVPGVDTFKIIQENRLLTRVQLVTDRRFVEADAERIRRGISDRLGADVEVRIERVAEIPRERSGKYRYVVSKVSS